MIDRDYLKIFKRIKSNHLTLLLALYYLLGLNFTLLNKVHHIITEQESLNIFFTLSIPFFFLAVFIFLFTPFVSKYIAKPIIIFLIITSACTNYGAYNFGIIFNKDMMVNIFETSTAEATDYINLKLIIWLFFFAFLPSIYIAFVKIEYRPFLQECGRKVILMAGCVITVLIIAGFSYKTYASVARNNPKLQKDIIPFYYITSSIKYIKTTYFPKKYSYKALGQDAVRVTEEENEKYLFIVLVGETARSQNYQLNGYNRPTNVHTQKIDNIVSFKNVESCGTATAISLPCMFSMLNKSDYSKDAFNSQDNIVDILKHAGYRQIWLDNNTGCKGICTNIESRSIKDLPNSNCEGEECTDNAFLNVLDETIKDMQGEDGVIYLHLLGSHGPSYYLRYPKEHAYFQPDCETSDLQNCSREEIINSYDNTIRFTDYIMSETISHLKKYKDDYYTSLLYISDHGESLGENGLYLHGMPYNLAPEEQTHVPFMIWLSDKMIAHEQLDMSCLKKIAQEKFISHDYISSTILEMMDIQTAAYDPSKDIISQCSAEREE